MNSLYWKALPLKIVLVIALYPVVGLWSILLATVAIFSLILIIQSITSKEDAPKEPEEYLTGSARGDREWDRMVTRQRRDMIKHGIFKHDENGKLVQIVPGGKAAKEYLKSQGLNL